MDGLKIFFSLIQNIILCDYMLTFRYQRMHGILFNLI